MSDPSVVTPAAAAAATMASAQQIQGVAGHPKMPNIAKAQMKQMLDDPEVYQELSKLVAGNASATQAILEILRAMTSVTDINYRPKNSRTAQGPSSRSYICASTLQCEVAPIS